MRSQLVILTAVLSVCSGCVPETSFATSEDGTLYVLQDGGVFRVDGDEMAQVLVTTRESGRTANMRSFADSIPLLAVRYDLRFKSFGPTDVRCVLNISSSDGSGIYSGTRHCWEQWTNSVPYMEFRLEDLDGFQVGSIELGQFSDRAFTINPSGDPRGFVVRGAITIDEAE